MDRSRSAHNNAQDLLTPLRHASRSRRLTNPSSQTRDADLFLDLANDSADTRTAASSVPRLYQTPHANTSRDPADYAWLHKDPSISSRSLSRPAPPPPQNLDTYPARHHSQVRPQSSSSQAIHTTPTADPNLSMRPFRPAYKSSHISKVSYETPKATGSLYASPWTNDPSPISPPCTGSVDSTGSATAVSTVWDEVDDLKGRIDRYRTGGRRITSSGAILEEHGDRPRTATTMTTNSSSYANHALSKVAPSLVGSSGNKTHDLLKTALSKVRAHVEPNVYQSLESCASDLIGASAVLDSGDTPTSPDNPSSPVTSRSLADKRVKRKLDNACRTLTELCIALMQQGSHPNGTRLVESRNESRQTERAASRVSTVPRDSFANSTYLEERRARLERIGSGSRPSSSLSRQPPQSAESDRQSSLARHSSALAKSRPRRLSLSADAGESLDPRGLYRSNTSRSGGDSEDRDSTVRAPSMTATEVSQPQPSPISPRRRHKISRDYIDQSPLPDTLSPSLRRTLHTNQSHTSLNSAYTTMTYDSKYRPRADYVSTETGGNLRAGSSLLAQRLEQRRQQQNVASSNQLGSITGLPEVTREYSRPGYSRRPQSSGQGISRRYEQS